MSNVSPLHPQSNIEYWEERIDLAASFRWTERLDMHEGVANHFSLAVNEDGTRFLMNPNQMHFSRIKASDLLLLDANDQETLDQPNAPDPTAWGLHGSIHRNCPHARCVMHVHSSFATVLACLADSTLQPIEQDTRHRGRTRQPQDQGGGALESARVFGSLVQHARRTGLGDPAG